MHERPRPPAQLTRRAESVTAMTPERWQKAKALFTMALEVEPQAREAWLREASDTDDILHDIVSSMLLADAAAQPEPASASAMLVELLPQEWQPGVHIGPYVVDRCLGSGGMGEVYLARRDDGTVDREVAIKRLRQGSTHPDLLRRFLVERRILARLEHPHIARFLDAGTDAEGRPYVVMEYVDGTPITSFVAGRRLGVDATLHLFLKVLDAARYSHAQLIIHRDIKPGNVLVDAQGEPKLLDFGIAKPLVDLQASARASQQTAFELRCFSLQYAAPEQLRPGPIGTACDVYSLGVLLYELLSGNAPLPLEGLSYSEAERKVLEVEPSPPSRSLTAADQHARARRVRGDLDRIVLHALEKSPRSRYPSVEAFATDLWCVLESRPISLRAPQRWYRAARFLRRHALPVALGGIAALSLLTGALLSWRQSLESAAQRDAALGAQRRAEAITGVLLDAFDGADPSRHRGERLSARDVLDVAAVRLQHRTDLDPRSAVELNTRLAEVLLAVGEVASARQSARSAAAHAQQLDAADLIVGAFVILARAEIAAGDLAAAELALDAAESGIPHARFPTDSGPHQAQARIGVARVELLAAQGQPHAANELAAALHVRSAATLGHDHADARLVAVANLQRLAAAQNFEAVLALGRSLLAGRSPDLLDSMTLRILQLQARALRELDRLEASFDIQQQILASVEKLFGQRHPAYARALNSMAQAAAASGRMDLADGHYRAGLDLSESLSGGEPSTLTALFLGNYASFLIDRDGASAAAETMTRRSIAMAVELLPAEHQNHAFLQLHLGRILHLNGKYAEARDSLLAADALFAQRDAGSRVALTRLRVFSLLAEGAIALREPERARAWLGEADARVLEMATESTIDEETGARLARVRIALAPPMPGPGTLNDNGEP